MKFISAEAHYTLQFINQTNKSLFLTGKAGTGKTTLLKEIIATTYKNTVVVAPTGIAALNAGGVTIHSLFQLPFAAFIPNHEEKANFLGNIKFENRNSLARHFKMNATKRAVIRNMELLIVDEVSMLRADVLDAIDFMLRKVRRKEQAFGGVQVLFIGDLLQLPPVVKNEEWQVLSKYYRGMFFFHAHVIQQNPLLYIELEKIFRQTDSEFISVLNNLRQNKITPTDLKKLNQFVQPNFNFKENKGYITLTTHNAKADTINQQSLQDLKGKSYNYFPEIIGNFPAKIFPLEEKLELKKGAQIMFVKNDLNLEKQYFNGKMGIIHSLAENEILVHFPEENKIIEVEKYEWQNIQYQINENTKEVEEEIIGTFVHYPIKLAWAITVHKSQGLTFNKAALDVSRVFAPGQAYVAFSRLRSLKGLVLLAPIQMNGITNNMQVLEYATNKTSQQVLQKSLQEETTKFLKQSILQYFNFKILVQQWRNLFFSFNEEVSKSVKLKHVSWVEMSFRKMEILDEPSQKFQLQLSKLFTQKNPDLSFIQERCHAAYNYFFTILDEVTENLLLKIEEIKRTKKVKVFYEELTDLEELQIKAIINLKKAKKLLKLLLEEKEIKKENWITTDIIAYKINKLTMVAERFKKEFPMLIEEEIEETSHYQKKKKRKTKEPKKSTIEETFELWQQKLSVSEIAQHRKLTNQTIYNHLAKLLQMQKVQLSDILPKDTIKELQKAFKTYKGESLSELKEIYGEQFTWDELRLYKAILA